MEQADIKTTVRSFYAGVAKERQATCCKSKPNPYGEQEDIVRELNLGVSCGNPVALSSLQAGEVVLDLGSGGGLDCFLAAARVGEHGLVIGVDMTPEMISKANANKAKLGVANVEFRLGEIEHLPVDSASVDVVISNCVLNLVPDKLAAFKEIYRVLKPEGRACISDVVLLSPLPEDVQKDPEAWAGCIAGALLKETYVELSQEAGFSRIEVMSETSFGKEGMDDRLKGKLQSLSYVLRK